MITALELTSILPRTPHKLCQDSPLRDFSIDLLVNNLPCKAGDMGLIPVQGTMIPHAKVQLDLHATTRVHNMKVASCCRSKRKVFSFETSPAFKAQKAAPQGSTFVLNT